MAQQYMPGIKANPGVDLVQRRQQTYNCVSNVTALLLRRHRMLCLLLDMYWLLGEYWLYWLQMLQHVWTYKPLVHDVLSMHANSITIEAKAEAGQMPGTTSKKRYEVSPPSTVRCDSAIKRDCEIIK